MIFSRVMAESKLFATSNCIIYCRSIIFGHIFAGAKTRLSAIPLPLQPLSSLRSESGRLRRGYNPLCEKIFINGVRTHPLMLSKNSFCTEIGGGLFKSYYHMRTCRFFGYFLYNLFFVIFS